MATLPTRLAPGQADLLPVLYDCASGQAPWEEFLSGVGRLLEAKTVVFFCQVPRSQDSFFGSIGIETDAVTLYRGHYAARNILMTMGARLHVPGLVRTTETICSERLLLRSEFYNDFMRHQDLRYSIGITASRSSESTVHLGAFRAHGQASFGQRDIERLQQLSPHVQAAVRVQQRLTSFNQRTQALEEVIGNFKQAVALVSRSGRVVYVNAAMEAILRSHDPLTLDDAGLSARTRTDRDRVAAVIASAARGGSGGQLVLQRPSGQTPYLLMTAPILRQIEGFSHYRPAALVFVTEQSQAGGADVLALQWRYGFTRAEARVSARLAAGRNLREIAQELSISIHTVRTHLKRALSKAGARRQAGLVRLILMGVRQAEGP